MLGPHDDAFKLARDLWDEHRSAPFPDGLAGEEFDGLGVILVDADAAGLIATILGGRQSPVPEQEHLSRVAADLARLISLVPHIARAYFERLHRLATLVAGM